MKELDKKSIFIRFAHHLKDYINCNENYLIILVIRDDGLYLYNKNTSNVNVDDILSDTFNSVNDNDFNKIMTISLQETWMALYHKGIMNRFINNRMISYFYSNHIINAIKQPYPNEMTIGKWHDIKITDDDNDMVCLRYPFVEYDNVFYIHYSAFLKYDYNLLFPYVISKENKSYNLEDLGELNENGVYNILQKYDEYYNKICDLNKEIDILNIKKEELRKSL